MRRGIAGSHYNAGGSFVLILALAASGFVSRSLRADVYEFVGGGRVEGPAWIDGDPVNVRSPRGGLVFDRSDFRRIEAASWPPDEWSSRREAALRGSPDDRHAAACWALDHGLVTEASTLWREAGRLTPGHVVIARMVRTLEALTGERPDPVLESFAPVAPAGYSVERGPHVLIWHHHEPSEARRRVELLETILVAFYLEFARHGLELEVPSTRLPSIWFVEHAEYLRYLESEGANAFRGTRGYHHPTRGLVASYDARSDDDQRRARESIGARRAELAAFRKRIDAAPTGARVRLGREGAGGGARTREAALGELDRLSRDLDRQELLLDLAWQRLDEGTAAHELIHQLVTRSGLAPRYAAFPIWLHEGLAMQFEAFRGGLWAGAGTPVELRLADWRAIHPAPPLAPLLRDDGLGRGYRRDPYSAAWAWVYYLRIDRPDDWIGLLDTLRLATPDVSPAAERARAVLESTLDGSIPVWEAAWHQRLRSLPAPRLPPTRQG